MVCYNRIIKGGKQRSTRTENLNLFKWDTDNEQDLASIFDIDKTLNENWDKIDTNAGSIDTDIAALQAAQSSQGQTVTQLENAVAANSTAITALQTSVGGKVDKIEGKGLSTNDFTNEDKADIAQNAADILLRSLITETGNKIDLEINSSTFVMVAKLYDKNNNLLSTSTGIDLPLESMVVDAAYDSATKEIVLTLKNGNTTRFSIADLVNGLASQDDVDALEERVDIVEDRMDVVEEIMPTISATGTEITLQNTKKAGMKLALGGNTEQASTTGKSLINIIDGTESNNGLTATKASGIVTVNNTSTATAFLYIRKNDLSLNAGTYTLSAFNESTVNDSMTDLRITETSGQNIKAQAKLDTINSTVTFTLSENLVNGCLQIRASSGITFNNFIVKPMLEVGSTPSSYEPYTGGTASPNPDYPQNVHTVTGNNTVTVAGVNYPINLGTIELCKIGDYQDRIFKAIDGDIYYDTLTAAQKAGLTYGKWYLHKEIDKIILDGTENWRYSSSNAVFYVDLWGDRLTNSNDMISNYFNIVPETTAYANMVNGSFRRDSVQQNRTIFKATSYTTIETFKSWLSTHNTLVYYILATPTNTEITDTTLISQLEAISLAKSAEGTTTITHTNADLGFMLTAIAFENIDMEGYVRDTDYAAYEKAGVIKTVSTNGLSMSGSGYLRGSDRTYAQYQNDSTTLLVDKGTLENVIVGKGLVSNTDYATSSTGGVVKVSDNNATQVGGTGNLLAQVKTYSQYESLGGNAFIGKSTLENVLAEYYKKQVVLTQAQYDAITTPDENTLYIIKEA